MALPLQFIYGRQYWYPAQEQPRGNYANSSLKVTNSGRISTNQTNRNQQTLIFELIFQNQLRTLHVRVPTLNLPGFYTRKRFNKKNYRGTKRKKTCQEAAVRVAKCFAKQLSNFFLHFQSSPHLRVNSILANISIEPSFLLLNILPPCFFCCVFCHFRFLA